MSVSMADIAKRAGASRTTVSHVLRGTWRERRITDRTSRHIQKIAAECGYRSNFLATSLASRKTGLIGVQFPSLSTEHWSDILGLVEREARALGYRLLLSMPTSHTDERSQIEMLMDHQVDGLILAPLRPRRLWETYEWIEKAGKPFVFLGNIPGAQFQFCSVVDDNIGQVRMVMRHLIELGHSRIAQVVGAPKNRNVVERYVGYRKALHEAGIPFRREYLRMGKFSRESAREQVAALMALSEPPTAIHCLSDPMAIGAIEAVEALGLRVPDDVAVVGYADSLPYKSFQRIPLTTIRQPREELAKQSVKMLFTLMRGEAPPVRSLRLPGELVVRRSTTNGSPPTAGE